MRTVIFGRRKALERRRGGRRGEGRTRPRSRRARRARRTGSSSSTRSTGSTAANRTVAQHRDRARDPAASPPRRDGAARGRAPRPTRSTPSPRPSGPGAGPQSRLPEITPAELTPELLRAAILEHGALLVRGPDGPRQGRADRRRHRPLLRGPRAARGRAPPTPTATTTSSSPSRRIRIGERSWIEEGGGVLAVDSPRLLFDMLESLRGRRPARGDRRLPRRALGDLGSEVHAAQGDARRRRRLAPGRRVHGRGPRAQRLALAVALRRRRPEHGRRARAVSTTSSRPGPRGRYLDFQVSQAVAEEAAGEVGIVRPIFEPGRRAPVRRPVPAPDRLRPRRCRTRATRSRAGSSDRRRTR